MLFCLVGFNMQAIRLVHCLIYSLHHSMKRVLPPYWLFGPKKSACFENGISGTTKLGMAGARGDFWCHQDSNYLFSCFYFASDLHVC